MHRTAAFPMTPTHAMPEVFIRRSKLAMPRANPTTDGINDKRYPAIPMASASSRRCICRATRIIAASPITLQAARPTDHHSRLFALCGHLRIGIDRAVRAKLNSSGKDKYASSANRGPAILAQRYRRRLRMLETLLIQPARRQGRGRRRRSPGSNCRVRYSAGCRPSSHRHDGNTAEENMILAPMHRADGCLFTRRCQRRHAIRTIHFHDQKPPK